MARPCNRTHLRLCFSGLRPRAIREAIGIVGKLIAERMNRRPAVVPRGLAKAAPLV
jgi:DNA-binding transcriptional MocR family regulator